MGNTVSLRLGEWMPDRNPIGNGPNLITAQGCYPEVDGYRNYPRLAASLAVGSLASACVGAASGRRRIDGTPYTAAATTTKLYVTNSAGVITDRTGTWSLGSSSTAKFVQYADRLLACSIEHPIQSHTLSGTSAFADLSADAPQCRHLAVIGQFVIAGNIVGRGASAGAIGTARDGLQWSAFMNPGSWPAVGTDAAKAVLSDFRILPGFGGDVQGITGGREYGIVLQERQVLRAEVVGGTSFINFLVIDTINGCDIPETVIQIGGMTFYHAQAGWMVCDGQSVRQIGNGRIDRTFAEDIDMTATNLCSTSSDPNRTLAMFAYPGNGHATGSCNKILVYNYTIDRWSIIVSENIERLVQSQQTGPNVDTPISANIDTSTFDVDAVSFDGSRPMLAAFSATSHTLKAFTGGYSPMTIVCGDFEAIPGRCAFIRSIRPHHKSSGTVLVRIGGRNSPASDPTVTGWSFTNLSNGNAGVRSVGRYQQVHLMPHFGDGLLSGFEADVEAQGTR